MTMTAQTIVETGMKLHGDLDSNVRTLIYTLLGSYLDKLWSIFDVDQAAKIMPLTISNGVETVAMETDMLRLDSITYDSPYQGMSPHKLTPRQYNYAQSALVNTSGSPPTYVWPDYGNRLLKFQPIPSVGITGKIMYYPQFADIAAGTDLQFFPMTRLLELFAYLAYARYDGVQPDPQYSQEFAQLELQFTAKYWSGGDPPTKQGSSWYNSVGIAIE